MASKLLFLVLFFAGSVRSDVYYKHPSNRDGYPLRAYGYYWDVPEQHRGYAYVPTWIPRAYGVQGNTRRNHYVGDISDGDYYNGDVVRKTVHEAEDSGLKAASGAEGSHAVSVDTKGIEDFAVHSAGRGLYSAGEAASGKVQEYGTTGNGAYDGFGKAGFKKGHRNSGFQKSYNKEESGKDSKFMDEDLKVGGETFVKNYGDKFGHSGREGYEEEVKGYGYDHAGSASGAAKSGLHSTGKHDVFHGEQGHKGGYDRGDSFVAADKAAKYHGTHQTAGKAAATIDGMNGPYQQPYYYL